MGSVFEKMIQDLSGQDCKEILDECMGKNAKKIKNRPLRYRLIALGFVTHMTLEQLDKKLQENGCEQLYARNFIEATLIYAFSNKMTYQEWKELEELCEKEIFANSQLDPWFNESAIRYSDLRKYLESNSQADGDKLKTLSVTKNMREQIEKESSKEQFIRFVELNLEEFRSVREKARYYYCKYLNFYIEEKIESYLTAYERRFGMEQAAMDLAVLKCKSDLRKKSESAEDVRKELLDSRISFGNIYDAFNYFYFSYISADWMEVMLDGYSDDIEQISIEEQKKLAKAIRTYEHGWKDLSDREVVTRKIEEMKQKEEEYDQQYARNTDTTQRGYQKGRAGENSVRNYIKGNIDIDRTTLICYLLFFGQEGMRHKEHIVDRERLDHILGECGYPILRKQDGFDNFIMQYLEAENRAEFLVDNVVAAAEEQKNFYLYNMYQGGVNEYERLKDMIH